MKIYHGSGTRVSVQSGRIARLFRPAACVFMAITFAFSFVIAPAGAQVDMSPEAASGKAAAEALAKTSLPRPGNITVNFKDVDIITVLNYLSEISGIDIVPTPGVEGTVTMRLRDKPWEVALDVVTRNYGYAYSSDAEQGIIRVMPKGQLHAEEPVTEVIPLNNLIREVTFNKEASASSSGEDVKVEQKEESVDKLLEAVTSMLDSGKGEKVTFIPSVNALIVTAIPARMGEIKEMIAKIDRRIPQIILDAKVIEITLSDDDRFGVDWNAIISAAGAARPVTFPFTDSGILKNFPGSQRQFYPSSDTINGGTDFPLMDIAATLVDPTAFAPTANALFTYGTLDFSTFTATLSMLQQRTDTEILSSPRITTLDNQKATIKVVDKIMLQKTQQTTDTAGIVTVVFESEADAREVGVKLTVMPHVNDNGDISVNLLPEVSAPLSGTANGFTVLAVGPAGGTSTLSLTFSSREANTIVRVRDGETIFLGGLIRKTITNTDNKFPILGDLFSGIPVIGNIFRYERENIAKSEIVFFVTVHLVRDGMDSIEKSQTLQRYNTYFPGKEKGEEGEKASARKPVVLKKGKMRVIEKKVEVPVTVSGKNAGEAKEHKPFLDFRKE